MREFELLGHIYAHNAQLRAASGGPALVLVPPGDDMALLQLRQNRVLIAADQVIEGRHFTRATPLDAVGRKAVLRNISDIAAMAGVPIACVATAALPRGMADDRMLALYEALRAAAEECSCPLVGGDTGTHVEADAPLVVGVTVLAEPGPTGRVVERQGACPGDALCVTGSLGGSLAADGGGRHLEPRPRVRHALELVRLLGDRLHSMIDISDGLGRDAAHLALGGDLNIQLDISAIPCMQGCTWQQALGDGEDYELAFACEGAPPKELLGVPVTVVGTFVAVDGSSEAVGAVWAVDESGRRRDVSRLGWEHGTGGTATGTPS